MWLGMGKWVSDTKVGKFIYLPAPTSDALFKTDKVNPAPCINPSARSSRKSSFLINLDRLLKYCNPYFPYAMRVPCISCGPE